MAMPRLPRTTLGNMYFDAERYDEAIRALREAIKLDDSLQGAEPPHWPLPVRQYLGPILLLSGRPAEAEGEYRADLKWYPENGWSLFGLLQSLKAQRKESEVHEIAGRFEKAWAHADVTLAASRF